MVASGTCQLSLNTTALVAGSVSAKLTILNTSIIPTTHVLTNISNYSGIVTAFSAGPQPCPNIFISDVTTGSCSLQIVSNGYTDMGATDTLNVFIAIR